MVNSEHGTASDSCELTPEDSSLEQEELQVLQLEQGGKRFKKSDFLFFKIGCMRDITNLTLIWII